MATSQANQTGRAPDIEALERALRDGDRGALARAITLVESRKDIHRRAGQDLIERVLPATGGAVRIGLSGVPGAGKSTLIDSFGTLLTRRGHKVAVLAVDPSSGRSGGSILGDKTRMERLSVDASAFIRPSPSGGMLGGVARATRESLLLCEAAGFDVILVETIGAGQAEYAVADMVDVFVLLVLAGGGDQLQGIKKGALEIADILALNKADADREAARRAAREYESALQIVTPGDAAWRPPVLSVSGRAEEGLDTLWETIADHRATMAEAGLFEQRRRGQRLKWMWAILEGRLLGDFKADPQVEGALESLAPAVEAGEIGAGAAAERLLAVYGPGGAGEDAGS